MRACAFVWRVRLFTRSMCGKKLWHTYCHSHEVEVAAFQLAVQLFMKDVLRMSEEDVAALLTPANLVELGVAADCDGSGKVCVCGKSAGRRTRRASSCQVCVRVHCLLPPVALAAQVSVMEAIKLFDRADAPFEDLVRNACAVGRSGAIETMRKHPVAALMRRFREQVRAWAEYHSARTCAHCWGG